MWFYALTVFCMPILSTDCVWFRSSLSTCQYLSSLFLSFSGVYSAGSRYGELGVGSSWLLASPLLPGFWSSYFELHCTFGFIHDTLGCCLYVQYYVIYVWGRWAILISCVPCDICAYLFHSAHNHARFCYFLLHCNIFEPCMARFSIGRLVWFRFTHR